MFSVGGRSHIASRIAWELHPDGGKIPRGIQVLHTCDNPPCCNFAHLFLGTVADNMRDRDLKGRRAPARGERHGQAKLTDAQIAEIRELYIPGERGRPPAEHSQRALARRFGVSQAQVGRVLRGESR